MSKKQQRRPKHIPRRTCVICRETRSKQQLTRLVRTIEGVHVDPTGKLPGRGAYLCDQAACWLRAAQGETLGRALRTELTDEERAMIAAHTTKP